MNEDRLESTVWRLRVGLLWLVLLGLAGIALLLAFERHWDGYVQWIPWACLGVILVSLLLVVVAPGGFTRKLVRAVTILTIVVSCVGMWQHFDANYNAAAERPGYSAQWEGMSLIDRVWEVGGGSVGHVPVYAAAALIPVALALLMATAGLGEQDDPAEYMDPRQRR